MVKPRSVEIFEGFVKTSHKVLRKSPEQIADEVTDAANYLLEAWGQSEIDTKLGEKFLASVKELTARVVRREVYSVLKGES